MHILNFSFRSWVHKLHYHVIYIPTFAQSEIQRGMISLSLLGNNSGLSQMILVRLLCCIKHYFHSLIKKTIDVLRVCVHISDDRTIVFNKTYLCLFWKKLYLDLPFDWKTFFFYVCLCLLWKEFCQNSQSLTSIT